VVHSRNLVTHGPWRFTDSTVDSSRVESSRLEVTTALHRIHSGTSSRNNLRGSVCTWYPLNIFRSFQSLRILESSHHS
jgi:hypothetical protein